MVRCKIALEKETFSLNHLTLFFTLILMSKLNLDFLRLGACIPAKRIERYAKNYERRDGQHSI